MNDITIGPGSMGGKGIYAARDFKKGEIVVSIDLQPISFTELKALPPEKYLAAHNFCETPFSSKSTPAKSMRLTAA